MWLRDSLPKDLVGARVLTYGYKSALVESKSFQGIEAIASAFIAHLGRIRKESNVGDQLGDVCWAELGPSGCESIPKPLIFLAHSLGGLVLKQVFTLAALVIEFSTE
jgi:hypothetical protein